MKKEEFPSKLPFNKRWHNFLWHIGLTERIADSFCCSNCKHYMDCLFSPKKWKSVNYTCERCELDDY